MFKAIYDYAIENGGGSFDLCDGDHNPTTGYMVSLAQYERRYTGFLAQSHFMQYAGDHMYQFAVMGHRLGVWKSGNEWVLDVSANISDINDALEFARINNQEAIWDCTNQTEIKLSNLVY